MDATRIVGTADGALSIDGASVSYSQFAAPGDVCVAPVVKVIHDGIGILRGSVTTLHDMTNTQTIVDAPHKVLAWYDNEWGYANRLVELTRTVALSLPAAIETRHG
jgi:hypothetical protein